MAGSAQAENRSAATRSPSGKPKVRGKRGGNRGRKRKPPLHRIQEDSADRSELWAKGEQAKARERDSRVPVRLQVDRLTTALDGHFRELRDEKVGTIPLPPTGPVTMREENTKHRKSKRGRWKGE